MKVFSYAHATHPQWQMAAELVLAQLRAQLANPAYAPTPTLALLYITDHYALEAKALLDYLSGELPMVTDWSGTVGIGIATNNAEYFNEPALAVMLLDLPSDQYRVFSGVAPLGLGFEAHTALVHADPAPPNWANCSARCRPAPTRAICLVAWPAAAAPACSLRWPPTAMCAARATPGACSAEA